GGLFGLRRLGSRRHRARSAVRPDRAGRDGGVSDRSGIAAHADADGVSRLLAQGSSAGLGHRSGMTLDLRDDFAEPAAESSVARRGAPDTSLRALHRHLASHLPASVDWSRCATGGALELSSESPDLPRLIEAEVIEGGSLRAVRVPDSPVPGFVAFLDGTQTSRVAWYDAGMPIVHGAVAAVIRVRRNRRMATWRLQRGARVYAPRRLLSAAMNGALDTFEARMPVVDTTVAESTDAPSVDHPFAVADAARHFVQRDRERLEQELAAQWCNVMSGPLFVDGGIGGSERTASQ